MVKFCTFDITKSLNMLSKYTAVLFLLFVSSGLFAQLPDGSEAPNFNLTDLNGNTHILYDILEEDKSMIIDFSATWCGNCWNYHQSKALDNVYDMYGPDGTDKTRVLWIEADANTSAECITNSSGCMGSTIGDWTNGSNHPYINLDNSNISVKSDYNINSFPTIIGIAPNKKMYEIGKLTNLNTWDSWINETFALDYTATVSENAIDLEVIAGSGTISYEWSNGATSQDLNDLDPGIYYCTITEGRGHSIETIMFEINASSISISCPPSVQSHCSIDDIPAYNNVEDFTNAGGLISGNTDPNSFVLISETSDEQQCPETFTRVYSIGNGSGQVVECTQEIIIHDTEAPLIIFNNDILISETELESSKITSFEILEMQASTIEDNCGIDPSSIALVEEISSNTVCEEIIRNYEISDYCGNVASFSQSVFIELGSSAELSFNSSNDELSVNFQPSSNFDDIIQSYLWDFGDGMNSSESMPSHNFDMIGTYNVCLTVSTAQCGDKTTCMDIEVKMDVSVHNQSIQSTIEFYPNPAGENIHLLPNSKELILYHVSIIDLKGNQVLHLNNPSQIVDISGLETGVYIIQFSSNAGNVIKKLVKI